MSAAQLEEERREEREALGQQQLPPLEEEVAAQPDEAIELLDDNSVELSSGATMQHAESQRVQPTTQKQDVVAASGVPAPEPGQ